VNRQLANVIAEAKIANVPKDIITRNIDKVLKQTVHSHST
jgi:transcriptional/translational regulatory protein YebC/TACO1